MKVLVACEYSGIVSSAFRNKGHNVVSCDLLPSEMPGEHYIGNVFDIVPEPFDLMIAFPPCTYLCNAQLHMKENARLIERKNAINFVLRLYHLPIKHIAIENPKGILSTVFRKPDQIVSPHYFGSPYSKDVCLWLKNLPPLIYGCMSPGKKKVYNHVNSRMTQEQKSKIKSKFFPELAAAMAEQWTF